MTVILRQLLRNQVAIMKVLMPHAGVANVPVRPSELMVLVKETSELLAFLDREAANDVSKQRLS